MNRSNVRVDPKQTSTEMLCCAFFLTCAFEVFSSSCRLFFGCKVDVQDGPLFQIVKNKLPCFFLPQLLFSLFRLKNSRTMDERYYNNVLNTLSRLLSNRLACGVSGEKSLKSFKNPTNYY